MKCPVCQSESTSGLNYCSRCGTKLTGADPVRDQLTLGMFLAVAAVGGIGLIGLFVVMSKIVSMGLDPKRALPMLVLVATLGSATTITVVALLIRFLSRITGVDSLASLGSAHRQNELPALHAPNLVAVQGPPQSGVTEHTTRNMGNYATGSREV